jgi:hypothetical protein
MYLAISSLLLILFATLDYGVRSKWGKLCVHGQKNYTRIFGRGTKQYRVCTKCARQVSYDWKTMKFCR